MLSEGQTQMPLLGRDDLDNDNEKMEIEGSLFEVYPFKYSSLLMTGQWLCWTSVTINIHLSIDIYLLFEPSMYTHLFDILSVHRNSLINDYLLLSI